MSKEKKHKYIFFILPFLIFTAVVFRAWFAFAPLSAGDWSYRYLEEVKEFSFLPTIWNTQWGGGLGKNSLFIVPLEVYYRGMADIAVNIFHMSWPLYERVVWFMPFLFISAGGAIYFASFFLPLWASVLFAPIIFVFNTYGLTLSSGGQMGVAFGYAIAPWVLGYIIRRRQPIFAGLLFGLQMFFDPRIAYITVIAVGIYFIFSKQFVSFITYLFLPLCIAVGLHAFWIIPLVWYRNNPIEDLGAAYSSIGALRFFSFTDFSHALALLHGNWPENVFGKTGFLQPEFLLLPVLAFGGFLFGKKFDRKLGVIGLLAILGVFLTKGTNEPFGIIYEWLFAHLPGFNVFRDASKFFLLIILGYTVLIPVTLTYAINYLKRPLWKVSIVLLFFLFWFVTIRGTWMGVTRGTLITHTIPNSYIEVKNLILSDPKFSRSLWVPQVHRYAIVTSNHPAMSAQEAFGVSSQSAVLQILEQETAPEVLSRWAVRYIVVPEDTHNEFFLDDRQYSSLKRQEVVGALDAIQWLQKVPLETKTIDVYEFSGTRDHFYIDEGESVQWQKIHDSLYRVSISDEIQKEKLIFSESFDSGWILRIGGKEIQSIQSNGLNSFDISDLPTGEAEIIYKPHELLMDGLYVSVFVLAASIYFIVRRRATI